MSSTSAMLFEHDDTVVMAAPSGSRCRRGRAKELRNRSCGMRIGLVVETFAEQDSGQSDSEEDEENTRLSPGYVRVEWYPAGREEVVAVDKVKLLDRSLLCGEIVCRANDPNLVGYVQNTRLSADFVVLPEKRFVICGVNARRFTYLKEFDDSASQTHILYDSWVGILMNTNQRVLLETQEGYRCWIAEDAQHELEDLSWRRLEECTYSAQMWYENQPVKGPMSLLHKAEWVNKKPPSKFLKKIDSGSGKVVRFTIRKVELTSLTVNWIIPLSQTDQTVPVAPSTNIPAANINQVTLLDQFPYQYLQIGDRGSVRFDPKDQVVPYAEYKKRTGMLVSKQQLPNTQKPAAASRSLSDCSDNDAAFHTPPQSIDGQTKQETTVASASFKAPLPLSGVSNFRHPSDTERKRMSESDEYVEDNEYDTGSSIGSAHSPKTSCDSSIFGDISNNGDAEDVEMVSVAHSETSLSSSGLNPFQKVRKRLGTLARRFRVLTRTSAVVQPSGRRKVSREERQQGNRTKKPRLAQCTAERRNARNSSTEPAATQTLKTGCSYVVEALCVRSFPEVVWQDGTCEQDVNSTELRYFSFDLDDHGMLPGTCVLLKVVDDGSMWPVNGYGMIVKASAVDRVATVNWFEVSISTEDSTADCSKNTVVLPKLIKSDDYSVYELVYHSDYSYYTGQLVMLVEQAASGLAASRVGQVKTVKPELGVLEIEWADGTVSDVFPTQVVPFHQADEDEEELDDEEEENDEECSGTCDEGSSVESDGSEDVSNLDDLDDEELQSAADDNSWLTESEEECGIDDIDKCAAAKPKNKKGQASSASDSWMTESEHTESESAADVDEVKQAPKNHAGLEAVRPADDLVPSNYKYSKLWKKLKTLLSSVEHVIVDISVPNFMLSNDEHLTLIELIVGLKGFLLRLSRKFFYRQLSSHPFCLFLEALEQQATTAFGVLTGKQQQASDTAQFQVKTLRRLSELLSHCNRLSSNPTEQMLETVFAKNSPAQIVNMLVNACQKSAQMLRQDPDTASAALSSGALAVFLPCLQTLLALEAFMLCQFQAMCTDAWYEKTVVPSKAQFMRHKSVLCASCSSGGTKSADVISSAGITTSTAEETENEAAGSNVDLTIVADEVTVEQTLVWPFQEDAETSLCQCRIELEDAEIEKRLAFYRERIDRTTASETDLSCSATQQFAALSAEVSEKTSASMPAEPSARVGTIEIVENVPAGHRYKHEAFSLSGVPKKFLRAVKDELTMLRSSLPPAVFVKAYEERLDLFSFVIVGPQGTPFEAGLFLFDVKLKETYPNEPPLVSYRSFSMEQLNPNLYLDGKVCVSLLGTWSGKDSEMWNPGSNLLQVFVSIQGLILNAEPYFNEAGYESKRSLPESAERSRRYNENALLQNIISLIRIAENPPEPFAKECIDHLLSSGAQFSSRVEGLISGSLKADFPLQPVSQGFALSARRTLASFNSALDKLSQNHVLCVK